ncbi:MAG: carbohydrate-binding domain-containing protein [Acutalibacteraceae bacterium]
MKKTTVFLSLLLVFLLALSGCSLENLSESMGDTSAETDETGITEPATTVDTSDMFTDNDLEIGYDEETSAKIILSGDSASATSNSVKISGSTVTITDEGTYILSGVLNDGMVVVNAEDTDKIRLVLDGIQIENSDSAAIYVAEADKVFVTTAPGSENTLVNGGEYVAIDDNNIDAVIFSKADLTLNGSGELIINAAAGHGIVSKDDLVLTGGTYDITSASHGLSGKDSIRIANGTYTITSGKDGMQAENTDDTAKGFIYIGGGDFTIKADGDGISGGAYLQIEDGDFKITTGEGSAGVTMTSDAVGFGQNKGFPTETTASQTDDSVSRKGVKTDGTLTITGGNFITDTEDDSFHAGGDILITDGTFNIKCGDDGVHSDTNVNIQNGDFTISYCYEGIEGETVTIDNGTFDITAVDDGINAAGGTDGSGFGGGRPGLDQFSSSSASSITINGGTLSIVSDGDCVDSNGSLTINGGKLNLTCNGNGNTALDCDGTYTDNGGDITTNDGSENNPGQMGGGAGGMGGRGGMGKP